MAKLTKIQSEFLEALKENRGLVHEALEVCGVEFEELVSWQERNSVLRTRVKECKDARDDWVEKEFNKLIEEGDRSAIIAARKFISDEKKDEGDGVLEKVTVFVIKKADSKTEVTSQLQDMFSLSLHAADNAYNKAIKINDLESPYERVQREKRDEKDGQVARFMAGDLSEVESLQMDMAELMKRQASAVHVSEFVSCVKSKLELQRRLDEIDERERRKKELDQYSMVEQMDASVLGVSERMIREFRHDKYVKLIEISLPDTELVENE